MDTKDFEYLVEIARQESLSKAAARLYLSQPTLTKFLKKIEAEYGTPLFDRVGKKMVLTEAGRCCVQKSEQILALNRELDDRIRLLRQHDKGVIRIGISHSRSDFFLHYIIPAFVQRYPDLNFILTQNTRTSLHELLENEELDAIFVSNYSQRPYLDYVSIAREEMVLVVPEEHPLLREAVPSAQSRYPHVSHEAWSQYPFVAVPPKLMTGQYTRQLFQQCHIQPRIVLEVSTLHSVYTAVAQNIGIGIAPSMPTTSDATRSLRYLSLDDPQNLQWSFAAITRSQVSVHPVVREIIQMAQRVYPELSEKL